MQLTEASQMQDAPEVAFSLQHKAGQQSFAALSGTHLWPYQMRMCQ